jgi:hypothetical protein
VVLPSPRPSRSTLYVADKKRPPAPTSSTMVNISYPKKFLTKVIECLSYYFEHILIETANRYGNSTLSNCKLNVYHGEDIPNQTSPLHGFVFLLVLDFLNKHISIIKQLKLSKISLHTLATQIHVYIPLLRHYRLNAYHDNAIMLEFVEVSSTFEVLYDSTKTRAIMINKQ